MYVCVWNKMCLMTRTWPSTPESLSFPRFHRSVDLSVSSFVGFGRLSTSLLVRERNTSSWGLWTHSQQRTVWKAFTHITHVLFIRVKWAHKSRTRLTPQLSYLRPLDWITRLLVRHSPRDTRLADIWHGPPGVNRLAVPSGCWVTSSSSDLLPSITMKPSVSRRETLCPPVSCSINTLFFFSSISWLPCITSVWSLLCLFFFFLTQTIWLFCVSE